MGLTSLLPTPPSTESLCKSDGREVYAGKEEGSWGYSLVTSLELSRALQSHEG